MNRDKPTVSATAIVLAGGNSSRVGRDKAMLKIDGVPIIERIVRQLEPRFSEILIGARSKSDYRFFKRRVVADRIPGQGPLMAIASCLEISSNDLNFVVSCDVPDLPYDLIDRLLQEASQGDGAVPVRDGSRYEPLFAVYRKSMLVAANEALTRGDRKVISMYPGRAIREVHLDNRVEIRNLNTIADYQEYRLTRTDANTATSPGAPAKGAESG